MTEWKEYKLGDAISFGNGKVRPNSKGLIPVYGGNGILNFCDDYNYEGENIIIGRVGAYCGAVYYENNPIWVSDNALAAKPKRNFNTKFLYYFLKNLELNQFAEGSSHPLVTQSLLNSIDVVITDNEKEQRAIASILSSLDDKIDLLHRQNKTLEQLAETLFRQWFVEEAEESWKIGTLDDEFDFSMGQSPPGESYNEIGDGIIFFQGRTDFDFRFPKTRMFTSQPSRYAKQFDTLISVRAPVGDMNMAYTDCCIGRGLSAFRYKHNPTFYSYTYYKLRSLMQQIKQFEDNGTVFGSITKNDFNRLENTIPSMELINNFQKKVKPIDEKIFSNYNQIRTLTQLRDTLLPKLMSGEVRLNCDSFD